MFGPRRFRGRDFILMRGHGVPGRRESPVFPRAFLREPGIAAATLINLRTPGGLGARFAFRTAGWSWRVAQTRLAYAAKASLYTEAAAIVGCGRGARSGSTSRLVT